MKTKILLFAIIFCAINYTSAYSQISTFDSVKVLLSSNQYSYKNPNFFNSYSSPSTYRYLVYEKCDSLSSNIAIRKIYYDSIGSEVLITNSTSGQNRNPVMSEKFIVWESNISGNWDIYYSVNTSDVWSPPILLIGSTSDETNPYIYNNHTSPEQYNFYYLTYVKNNDIYFKSYKTSTSTWLPDTNLTSSIPYNCITPIIGDGNSGGTKRLSFLMCLTDSLKRIYIKTLTENYTNGIVSWDIGSELYQPKTQENLHPYFYEYDTLGSTHTLSFYKDIYTYQLSGKCLNSESMNYGIITDYNPLYWNFTVFACLNKKNDSSSIKISKDLNNYSIPGNVWKSFYVGNSSVNSRLSISSGVHSSNYYKLYVVWEKMLNGKTAFYNTYMSVFVNNIKEENEAVNFSLFQNYPNPFNPTTKIKFRIKETNLVTLKVYDINGKELKIIVYEKLKPGNYETQFDSKNFSSGIYFYKLQAGNYVETKKMILIK